MAGTPWTLLQMVNTVKVRLRVQPGPDLADAFSQRIVGFINKIQRGLMAKPVIWDQAKVYLVVPTVAGTSTYQILSGTDELDVVRYMSITDANGGVKEIKKLQTDQQFRDYSQKQTAQSQPLYYRNRTKDYRSVTIEVSPVPDAVYNIDVEAVIAPPYMLDPTANPTLNITTLLEGATMLAKDDKGILNPLEGEMFAFMEKMDTQTFGSSNEEEIDVE
jgi:hypothetical protein